MPVATIQTHPALSDDDYDDNDGDDDDDDDDSLGVFCRYQDLNQECAIVSE